MTLAGNVWKYNLVSFAELPFLYSCLRQKDSMFDRLYDISTWLMLSHHSTQKQLESVFLSASSKMLRTKNTHHGYTISRFCSKRNKPATTFQCHSVLKRRNINSFPLSIPSNHILSVTFISLTVSNNYKGFFFLEKYANMATG